MPNLADAVRAAQLRLPRRGYGWSESARLAQRRRHIAEPDIDSWVARTHDGDVRLLIAPANSAGQASAWARAAERHLTGVGAVAWMFSTQDSYAFNADVSAPAGVSALGGAWQRRLFDAVCATFTHVIIESGRPLFGPLFGHDAAREAAALGDRGLGVAMAWHGTDIRLPSRERATNPHSPFRDAGRGTAIGMLEARARRNAALARASGVPQLYSTPDLAAHVPQGIWLPVAVDADQWTIGARPADDGPLRVLFQPSQAWVKGGALIEPVLDSLERDAVIARVPSGRVEPPGMPALVARADVVLDQFRLNLYGVAAAEAMMASRPVVALAGSPLREATLRLTGDELPIVAATAAELGGALTELATDADARAGTAAKGRAFAMRWHDGAASARALNAGLGLP